MIVPALSRKFPVAHRHAINQLSVQHTVCQGRGRRHLVRSLITCREGHRRLIDAQPLISGPLDVALRVDPAGQVVVQIAAFRHSAHEGEELRRPAANSFVIAGRPLLGRFSSALSTHGLRAREGHGQ